MPKVDKYHKPVNPEEISNNIGLYTTKSRRVVIDQELPEVSKFIQSPTGGLVVWVAPNGENNVSYLPAGVPLFLEAIKILTDGLVDGVLESTDPTIISANDLIWYGGR